MTAKIKACKCGGSPFLEGKYDALYWNRIIYSVLCAECGEFIANFLTKRGAIAAWNRRAGGKRER